MHRLFLIVNLFYSLGDEMKVLNNEYDLKYQGVESPLFIEKHPLLPHLLNQKDFLIKYSKVAGKIFIPDNKYFIGNFNSGIIKVKVKKVDGEIAYLYATTDYSDKELEFLLCGNFCKIDRYQIDNLVSGKDYYLYWAETICYMEPFDDGYQRQFIVYEIHE